MVLKLLLGIFDVIKCLFSNKASYPQHKKSGNLEIINSKEIIRSRKKPQWVIDEVIRLKAMDITQNYLQAE